MVEKSVTKSVVVMAPTNIALVKYWGKRCVQLNLPLNSSISVTMNPEHLKTTTKVTTCAAFTEDEVWLNGVKQNVPENKRLTTCFDEIRRRGRKQIMSDPDASASDITFYSQKVHVHTENSFPTAAGLASSASGYAALVFALGTLYDIKGDLTTIARQGSGSACRSLYGGFVEWQMGEKDNGEDSIGIQVFPETHWPELRIFVVVANDKKKKVGSTGGMQRSVETSLLLTHRAQKIVEGRMAVSRQAVSERNFPMLAEIIMKESNQLHAVCLDTYPPLHYLSDVSHEVMSFVHAYNEAVGSVRLAYSFDAGPNACLFTTDQFSSEVASLLCYYFSLDPGFFRGIQVDFTTPISDLSSKLEIEKQEPGLIKYVIHTNVGGGAQVISTEECLA